MSGIQRCEECKLYYDETELENQKCFRCAEPWADHTRSPVGIDLPDGPPGYFDLLSKMQARPTSFEVLLPFSHDPSNFYVAGKIYQDESRYWRIEGRSTKFRDAADASIEIVRHVDDERMRMLNEEFKDV